MSAWGSGSYNVQVSYETTRGRVVRHVTVKAEDARQARARGIAKVLGSKSAINVEAEITVS